MASTKNSNSGRGGKSRQTTTRQVSASSSSRSRAKGSKSSSGGSNSRAPRKTTTRAKSAGMSGSQKSLLIGMAILFGSAVLLLGLLAPDQGAFTRFLSQSSAQFFGLGRYVIPIITGLIGLYLVMRGMEQTPHVPAYRLLGFGIVFLTFLTFASMVALRRNPALGDVWNAADAGQGGGYAGALGASALTELLGSLGAIVTLVVFGLVGAVLLSGMSREQLGATLSRLTQPRPQTAAEAQQKPLPPINPGRRPKADTTAEPYAPRQLPLPEPGTSAPGRPAAAKSAPSETPQRADKPAGQPVRSTPAAPVSGPAPAAATTAKPAARPRPSASGAAAGAAAAAAATPAVTMSSADGLTWKVPTIEEILDSGTDIDMNNAAIREQVEVIEHTLESFGAPATVVEINQGPTITQYGVEPNYLVMRGGKRTKVKVGKIAGLADDLALALAARSIRIQAPVPGKGYVGIEVPNTSKALVSLRDVMESQEFAKKKSPLKIGLGQNVAGQPIVADLAAMPHVLIAGTTGSGKSVCVNALIACLLLQNTPDDLKLVMVDPKRVELTGYNGVPHLAAPVVVEMDRVVGTLQWALREMDNRYKLFASVGARNIEDYNKKINCRAGDQKLPNVVIIVDELADLMMLAPEDTERSITRLAQMARATGIHMVIATQRPSVDVVTGLIKANFPARIAFAVASSTDSRVILDTTGAERLLGQGDMLFQSPDAAAPVRLQGCFVSDSELQKLIHYWQTARRFQTIPAPGTAAPGLPGSLGSPPAAGATLPPTTADAAEERPRAAAPAVPPPTIHLGASAEATSSATTRDVPMPADLPFDDENDEEADELDSPVVAYGSSMPQAAAGLTQQPLWEALQQMEADAANAGQYEDELMPEAIAMVRQLKKASTSLLQRRFRIGYTRAARLMDALEDQGIIGPPTGNSKAREVYDEDGQATEGGEPGAF